MVPNALKCDVCSNIFCAENSPRLLPCTHTFCTPCIDGIITAQKKTCPNCSKEFTAGSAEDFTIVGIVLDVVKELSVKPKTRGTKRSHRGITKETEENSTKDSIAEIREAETKRLQETKNLSDDIEVLRKMRERVIDMEKGIEGSKEKRLEIKLAHQNILDSIDSEIDGLEKKMILILQEKGKTQDAEGEVPPIVAVKEIGGKKMVAPVRFNQVWLSHFAEGDVPPKSHIIKHEALMERSSRRAFLDLAVGNKNLGRNNTLGRIIIQVMDESNLALNFLHLCAGDLGPSYANSPLSRVQWEGQDGEHVHVGGYETSKEIINAAIIKQIDWNEEEQREIYRQTLFKAGEVRGFLSEEKASQFYIVTKDALWDFQHCFGIVEEGLDVLKDAILKYPNIRDVWIANCGLIMST